MLSLWRAEWLKVRKRPANWGILIISLLIVIGLIITFLGVALYGGKNSSTYAEARMIFAYPTNIVIPLTIVSAISTLLTVIFAANSIGSEYSRDTWKMVLIRHKQRTSFILVKLFSAFIFMIIVIISSIAVGLIFSALGAAILGTPIIESTKLSLLTPHFKSILSILIDVAFYSTLTTIAAIVTRSSIGGIVIGVVSSAIFNIMGQFSTLLARISPSIHLQNIQAQWVFQEAEMEQELTEVLGLSNPLSAWTSLIIILMYSAVFLGIGLYMFRRRDIAGS